MLNRVMTEIKNYHLRESVEANTDFSLYRAVRILDQFPLILKFYHTLPHTIAYGQLKREYQAVKSIFSPAVLISLGIDNNPEMPLLIFEDFACSSLKKIFPTIQNKVTVCIKIAVEIAKALEDIHHQNAIHGNLRPSNILLSADLASVKLCGFGMRTFREIHEPPFKLSPASTHYASPEQLKRVNREIDFKSDIYSLGVILYEMLTSRLPFKNVTDEATLYKPPGGSPFVSPHMLNPSVPMSLSKIVMRCLADEPKGRYPSTQNLKEDLNLCLTTLKQKWGEKSTHNEQTEIHIRLQHAKHFLENKNEIEELEASIERVAEKGMEIMIVTGDPALNKSSLLWAFQKKVITLGGYLFYGKFDASKRNIPFHGIFGAFKHFIMQILAETDVNLHQWHARIAQAIWPHETLIFKLFPELKTFIPNEQQQTETRPESGENDLQQAFGKCIDLLIKNDFPFVLVLEDLQWADNSSLNFIQNLCSVQSQKKIFLILTYKKREIQEYHPFLKLLNELKAERGSAPLNEFNFLHLSSLIHLIEETYRCGQEQARPLAEIILSKTDRVPIQAINLCKKLTRENLITYDPYQNRWLWDLQMIKNVDMTSSSSDILSTLTTLEKNTQNIVRTAAIIGNTFELQILSALVGQSEDKTLQKLQDAFDEDLITKKSFRQYYISSLGKPVVEKTVQFSFNSDTTRKVIYNLLPKVEREEMHYKIARTMLEFYSQDKSRDYLLDIARHYDYGSRLVKDPKENVQLIEINLNAGLQAKANSANNIAIEFFSFGIHRLPKDAWQNNYILAIPLYENLGLCELLRGHQKEAEKAFDIVLEKSQSFDDRIRILINKIQWYGQLNLYDQALNCESQALKLLKISFKKHPSRFHIMISYLKTRFKLKFKTIEDLRAMPPAKNPREYLLGSIYNSVLHTSYASGNLPLTVFTTCELMNLFVSRGATPYGTMALSTYATLISSEHFKDYKTGAAIGGLCLEFIDRYPNHTVTYQAAVIYYLFANRWVKPFHTIPPKLKEFSQKAFQSGADIYGVAALVGIGHYKITSGTLLRPFLHYVEETREELKKYKTPSAMGTYQAFHDFCRYLIFGDVMSNEKLFGSPHEDTLVTVRRTTWMVTMLSIMRQWRLAIDSGEKLLNMSKLFPNTPDWNIYHFYYALALANELKLDQDKKNMKLLKKIGKKLIGWAQGAPWNYAHQSMLIQAHIHHLRSERQQADQCFKEAIRLVKTQHIIHEEGVCLEHYADFLSEQHRHEEFMIHMQSAYLKYLEWGALKKAELMKEKYAFLKEPQVEQPVPEPEPQNL